MTCRGRSRLLKNHHVFVLEDVEAPAQGAVAPEVAALPFADLIALRVLDDDALGAEAELRHRLHAEEAERDQLSLGVLVADDERGEAAGAEQLIAVRRRLLEGGDELLGAPPVGE